MPIVGTKKTQFGLDDDVDIPDNMGFMVDRDCTISYLLRAPDDIASPDNFLTGVMYDLDIRRARLTGASDAATIVTVFFPRLVRDFSTPR